MRKVSLLIGVLCSLTIFNASAMHHKRHKRKIPKTNQFWWPNQLDLTSLRDHDKRSNPYGEDFDYAKEFAKLDYEEMKKDVKKVLTTSQDWWPADWGNYGPFFIRLSWHSAGTYRTLDGRGGGDGGQMRFDPLNSWPDNGNLDKARRLLWPVKKKYGRALSWGDLMILAGTVGMESMGFKIYGFAGGRADDWEPDLVYWGPEVEMLASDRQDKKGKLKGPLSAMHMGLIYVNPQGPKGVPNPSESAKNIRHSFGRMAMNDEETVALVAGGHTFGKMHGAHKAKCIGADPGGSPVENQALGWKNKCGKGHSEDATTSGFEGAWTQAPTKWTTLYLSNLLNNEWVKTKSPAGAIQWIPKSKAMRKSVPDAHVAGKMNPVVMTTADLALKFDPAYKKIAERFLANPEEFRHAFAKAWFKLTHRDMGPRSRYLGKHFPKEELIWQDPVPTGSNLDASDIMEIKEKAFEANLTVGEMIRTAWASASTFRASDMRGGANGARLALAPQKDWKVNNPTELKKVLGVYKKIQFEINDSFFQSAKVSLADIIVVAAAGAIEKAAKDAGIKIEVSVTTGRGDATQDQTDVNAFNLLKPAADAFRNYYTKASYLPPLEAMVDKADQLHLTIPEMTVLIGGLRVLGTNADGSKHGVLTKRVGVLSNDFFVNLLSMDTKWKKGKEQGTYVGLDRRSGKQKYTATNVDLIFGSNTELRAVAEVYAMDDAKEKFAKDFAKAWSKVMSLDRFDLKHNL